MADLDPKFETRAELEAFKVKVTVFMPNMANTSISLKRGERLFILTDKGLDEAPHDGPQSIMVITERFGCWPVVAIPVHKKNADQWRALPADALARMMVRVRKALSPDVTLAHSHLIGEK